jgi:hypothetical protein
LAAVLWAPVRWGIRGRSLRCARTAYCVAGSTSRWTRARNRDDCRRVGRRPGETPGPLSPTDTRKWPPRPASSSSRQILST